MIYTERVWLNIAGEDIITEVEFIASKEIGIESIEAVWHYLDDKKGCPTHVDIKEFFDEQYIVDELEKKIKNKKLEQLEA